jgi:hypothetical protein
MVTLEEWLQGVGVLALRELAAEPHKVHGMSRPKLIEYILTHADAREMAEESMRIEARIQAHIDSLDCSPAEAWDRVLRRYYRKGEM